MCWAARARQTRRSRAASRQRRGSVARIRALVAHAQPHACARHRRTAASSREASGRGLYNVHDMERTVYVEYEYLTVWIGARM